MNVIIFRTLCVASLLGLAACGGGGGGGAGSPMTSTAVLTTPDAVATTPATSTPSTNSMALMISNGVNAAGVNRPLVSVQLCAPGTGTCQTVDNVLIDTGSTGVRIAAAALDAALLAALPRERVDDTPLSACQRFISGYTWGTMRVADVTLGPKFAAAQPLQIIDDPAAGDVPAPCTHGDASTPLNTPTALGANGIIGLAAFLHDCGAVCAQRTVLAAYYTCADGASCDAAIVPLAMQAGNLVAAFAQDNNGVVLSLPAISSQGQGATVGTLYFGVGTQANNTLSAATVLDTDPQTLHFTATYKGASFPDSFLDSGSNFVFMNDATIATCPAGGNFDNFYCPADPLSLTASLATAAGTWLEASFSIVNAQSLFTDSPDLVAVDNVAVRSASDGLDFGIPFFYGKRIAVLNQGGTALGQDGPFTAVASY